MSYINRMYYKYCYVCEESKRTEDTTDYDIDNFENDELFFQFKYNRALRLNFARRYTNMRLLIRR